MGRMYDATILCRGFRRAARVEAVHLLAIITKICSSVHWVSEHSCTPSVRRASASREKIDERDCPRCEIVIVTHGGSSSSSLAPAQDCWRNSTICTMGAHEKRLSCQHRIRMRGPQTHTGAQWPKGQAEAWQVGGQWGRTGGLSAPEMGPPLVPGVGRVCNPGRTCS